MDYTVSGPLILDVPGYENEKGEMLHVKIPLRGLTRAELQSPQFIADLDQSVSDAITVMKREGRL